MDYKLVVSSQQADLHRPTIKNSFLLLFYVNSLADLRRCWGNYSLSLLCDDGAVCTLDTGVSAPLSIYFYGMIQQLHNAVVAPTGMGKNYGRIMPLLRQGWLVSQKIMHHGFFGQCFSGCLCSQEETSQLQPILLFWKIPLGTIIKLAIYPSVGS